MLLTSREKVTRFRMLLQKLFHLFVLLQSRPPTDFPFRFPNLRSNPSNGNQAKHFKLYWFWSLLVASSCHLQCQNLIQLLITLGTSLSTLFNDGINTFLDQHSINLTCNNTKQPGLKSYKLKICTKKILMDPCVTSQFEE